MPTYYDTYHIEFDGSNARLTSGLPGSNGEVLAELTYAGQVDVRGALRESADPWLASDARDFSAACEWRAPRSLQFDITVEDLESAWNPRDEWEHLGPVEVDGDELLTFSRRDDGWHVEREYEPGIFGTFMQDVYTDDDVDEIRP